jgi:hypothetical protein
MPTPEPQAADSGPYASTGPVEAATQAWLAMHAFVNGQDRREQLRDQLDLGPSRWSCSYGSAAGR